MDRRDYMRMAGPAAAKLRLARALAGIPSAQEPRNAPGLPPYEQPGAMADRYMPPMASPLGGVGAPPMTPPQIPQQQPPPTAMQPMPPPQQIGQPDMPPMPPSQQVGQLAPDPRYLPEQWAGSFNSWQFPR